MVNVLVIEELSNIEDGINYTVGEIRKFMICNGYIDFCYFCHEMEPKTGSNGDNFYVPSNVFPSGILEKAELSDTLISQIASDAVSRRKPFVWTLSASDLNLSPTSHPPLAGRNYSSGLALPLNGPIGKFGLFVLLSSFSCKHLIEKVPHHIGEIYLWASHLHELNIAHSALDRKADNPVLTEKERETLFWVARGKTNREIAKILYKSTATINFHVRRVMSKLDAANKCEAVAKALIAGLI